MILVGFTNSNPVEPPPGSVDVVSDSDLSSAPVPAALIGRYYDNPYMEEEGPDAVKRNSDIDEENEIPRYLQKRRNSAEGRRILEFIESLKALEEELALEALAREGLEADEHVANEVEPQNDVHKVNKRRFSRNIGRRYGFWATAINKMDNGHLRNFLGKHRNIYNVYKRQAPVKKWWNNRNISHMSHMGRTG